MENRKIENKKIASLVKFLLWSGVIFFVFQIITKTKILEYGIKSFQKELGEEFLLIKEKINFSLLQKASLPEDAFSHLNGTLIIQSKDATNSITIDFIIFENKVFLKERSFNKLNLFPRINLLESENEWYFFELSKEDFETFKKNIEDISQRKFVENIQKINNETISFNLLEEEIFSRFSLPLSENEKERINIASLIVLDNDRNFLKKIIFNFNELTFEINFANFNKEIEKKDNLEYFLTEKFLQINNFFSQ